MGKAWYRLYYHVTWSTYNRAPLITPQIEVELYPYLKLKAMECGAFIHECNGVEDHVHAAMTIPPRFSIGEVIGRLKGSSSHFINNEIHLAHDFAWQEGYGVVTISEERLSAIVRYIHRQKEHHRCGQTFAGWEISQLK